MFGREVHQPACGLEPRSFADWMGFPSIYEYVYVDVVIRIKVVTKRETKTSRALSRLLARCARPFNLFEHTAGVSPDGGNFCVL